METGTEQNSGAVAAAPTQIRRFATAVRYMIGHEANYRRWRQNYVFQTTGLHWRTVQAEIRQEFLTTLNLVYVQETGEPLPPQPTNARTEFLHAFAESAARSAAGGNPHPDHLASEPRWLEMPDDHRGNKHRESKEIKMITHNELE